MNKTVRLSKDSDELLNELAKNLKISKTEIITKALKEYKRDLFFKKADEIYDKMTQDEFEQEKTEQALWEEASLTDLEKNE
jgi:predicted transcriptional regulator